LLSELADAMSAPPGEFTFRGEQQLDAAKARQEAARRALELLVNPNAALPMKVRAISFELAALEQQRADLAVRASAPGTVSELHLLPGQTVSQQQQLMELDDTSR